MVAGGKAVGLILIWTLANILLAKSRAATP